VEASSSKTTAPSQRGVWAVAAGVALVGLFCVGKGFANGDAAVYWHAGSQLDFTERSIHLGYLVVAAGVRSPLALDLVSVAAAAATVVAAGRHGGWSWFASAIVGCAVVPYAGYAEVDLLWTALLAWAVIAPARVGAALVAVAVSISPTALLALPIVVDQARPKAVWLLMGALGMVSLLTLVSGGDWWFGDRGVVAYGVDVGTTLGRSWRYMPWICMIPVLWHRPSRLVSGLLLVAAPSDAACWALLAMAGSTAVPIRGRMLWLWPQVALSAWLMLSERGRVISETNEIAASRDQVDAYTLVVAPWSYGVRWSILGGSGPYSEHWRAVPAVRGQRIRSCSRDFRKVVALGLNPVEWPSSDDIAGWRSRLGCDTKPLPNVVTVIGCTVRKDRINARTAPYLDDLRRHGAELGDTISTAPWTKPAVASLLTGRHATVLGLAEPGPQPNRRVLPDDVTTLAEHLGEAGYVSVAVVANPNLDPRYGFSQGFDAYEALSPTWNEGVVHVDGAAVVKRATALIDLWRRPGRPVHLMVVMTDTHAPLDGEGPLLERYDAALGRLDGAVAQLDAALAERGFTEGNTLWMFLGDHGEGLSTPAGNGPGHGRYLTPAVAEVPWYVRGPDIDGQRVHEGLSSGLDVLPTTLGYLGLPADLSALGGTDRSLWLIGEAEESSNAFAFIDTWFRDRSRAAIYAEDAWCQIERSSAPDDPSRPAFEQGCFSRVDRRPVHMPEQLEALVDWREQQGLLLGRAGLSPPIPAIDATHEDALKMLGYLE
jgi:hypothetical protein